MKKNYSDKYPLRIRIKTKLYHFLKGLFMLMTSPRLLKELKEFKKLKKEIAKKEKAMKRERTPQEMAESFLSRS